MLKFDLKKVEILKAKSCLSTNEIVEKTGLGRTTVSRVLNGTVNPSAKSAGLIAKALNVDITELIVDED